MDGKTGNQKCKFRFEKVGFSCGDIQEVVITYMNLAQQRSLGGNISGIFRIYKIIQRNYLKIEEKKYETSKEFELSEQLS